MYLSPNPTEDGSITFGGYDIEKYAKKGSTEADIFWSKTISGEKFWTIGMSGAAFSKPAMRPNKTVTVEELANLSDVKAKYAIMDTGVSYALIPSGDFLKIKQGLQDGFGVSCKEPSDGSSLTSVYGCSCASYNQLPDIMINLETDKGKGSVKQFNLP